MKALISAGIFILFITGCKKEDNCNLTAETMAGSYRLTALTYRQSSAVSEQNLFSILMDCEKDNMIVFNSDMTFSKQDVGTTCIPAANEFSTWNINGTTLVIGDNISNVTSFDCNTLVTSSTNVSMAGDVLIATYVRQ